MGPVTAGVASSALGGGFSTGGGSLDFGQQSSSTGPFESTSAFSSGDFNYKSSMKIENIALIGLIALIGIWLWKR